MTATGRPMGRPPGGIPARALSKPPINGKRSRWRSVELARDYIAGKSHRVARALVKQAIAGDAQTGRWLLEHVAVMDDDGIEQRPIAPGLDRQQLGNGIAGAGMQVMIGVSLGQDFDKLAVSHNGTHEAIECSKTEHMELSSEKTRLISCALRDHRGVGVIEWGESSPPIESVEMSPSVPPATEHSTIVNDLSDSPVLDGHADTEQAT